MMKVDVVPDSKIPTGSACVPINLVYPSPHIQARPSDPTDSECAKGTPMNLPMTEESNLQQPPPIPADIEQAWFDAPESRRISSLPPPPSQQVGEFLGDELADAWLR